MSVIKRIGMGKLGIPVAVVFLFLFNWLASIYHARIDLTDEKRFTLSKSTLGILKKLEDPVQVDVFLKGATNSGFTKLSGSAEELLHEFREVAGKKFNYRFIDPDDLVEGAGVTYADTLNAMGVSPLVLNAQIKSGEQQLKVYPYALVTCNNKTTLVELYEGNSINLSAREINSAEAMLEYNFIKAVYKLIERSKPVIAYSTGNGEPTGPESFDLRTVLQDVDTLFTMNLNTVKFIPDDFNLLLIVKPSLKFSDEEKMKIDQFVMRGGRLLLFIDRLNAEMDSLKIKNEVVAYDRNLELDDLLFRYGTRIRPDLIMDLQCDRLPFDVNGNGQYRLLAWNYFPLFQSASNHLINKNLGFVNSRFVNSVDTSIETDGIRKTVLLRSSSKSRTISTPALVSTRENIFEPESVKFSRSGIPAAVLLEGKFTSLFRNRVSRSELDSFNSYGLPFLGECINANKMIVVADGDIVLNGFYKDAPLPMGVNPYSMVNGRQSYPVANRSFLLNCVDYLINEKGLNEAKAKDYTLRFLDPEKTENGKLKWQLINIAGPVMVVLLFAFFYQWLRRRKYAKS